MISALIPTRSRPELLARAVSSLLDTASSPANVEIMLRFDTDDETATESIERCEAPNLTAIIGEPLGYMGYATYSNELAEVATGDWLMVFNDDALMQTPSWDSVIESRGSDLKNLSLDNNHGRQYACFPCVPRQWYGVCGHLALDVRLDSWLQEVAQIAGCFVEENQVYILHDRHDLTGNNDDEIYRNRYTDPAFWTSYDSAESRTARNVDAEKIRAAL